MRLTLGLLLAAALSGCGTSVTMTPLNWSPTSTRLPPSQIEVFSSGPPSRPHVDVALLEAKQYQGLDAQGTGDMIGRLRAQASQQGCDAIVLGGVSERSGAPRYEAWSFLDPGSKTLHATCVVYKDDEVVMPFRRRAIASREADEAADDRPRQRIDREDPR